MGYETDFSGNLQISPPLNDAQITVSDLDAIRSALLSFDARHHLDWFNDIGGCETCGPEYDVNCSCGWSDEGYNAARNFRNHVRAAMMTWLGDNTPLWPADPDAKEAGE